MKVAIVHDYYMYFGGGEYMTDIIMDNFEDFDLYTSFYTNDESLNKLPNFLQKKNSGQIKTTWVQPLFNFFGLLNLKPDSLYKFFWLYAIVMRQLTIKNYDLVIIHSTFCAKYIRLENCKKIVYYCNTPTRFLYNLVEEKNQTTWYEKLLLPLFTFWLRKMDQDAVKYLKQQGCTIIANSSHIQELIQKIYKVDSIVINPPVATERLNLIERKVDLENPFYYYCGRIGLHKQIDIAVLACIQLQKNLYISYPVAVSQDLARLKSLVAQNRGEKYIHFLGYSSNEEKEKLLATCQSFLFPYKEDFGITPVESLAVGTPVIALASGGALNFVIDGVNGILFKQKTVESLVEAILKAEKQSWDSQKIKLTSQNFSIYNFNRKFKKICI